MADKISISTDQTFFSMTHNIDGVGRVWFEFRYMEVTQRWIINTGYGAVVYNGVPAVAGSLLFPHLPYDAMISTKHGLDPYKPDDFISGDCEFYTMTAQERINEIRPEVPATIG